MSCQEKAACSNQARRCTRSRQKSRPRRSRPRPSKAPQIHRDADCEKRMAKASNTARTIQDPHSKIKTRRGVKRICIAIRHSLCFSPSFINPSLATDEHKQPNRPVSQPRLPTGRGYVPRRNSARDHPFRFTGSDFMGVLFGVLTRSG